MKMIIINGPCGVGKSILGRKVSETLPLSFRLALDDISRYISHYTEYREERWKLVRAIGEAMVKAVFSEGRDIVIDKMLYDPILIDAYRKIAEENNAEIFEFLLWAPKDVVMGRARDRGFKENGLLTPEKCDEFWDKMDTFRKNRSQAILVDTDGVSEEKVFETVMGLL
ncbi:MAG: AAA family ATPase [Parcubacteria group bacterium]|nr:AAA family ATPase [Parcubacteria group bacterium]